ncbi:hypothetical protein M406DRAFT_71534 [Cryphonectria parasitica EP155]|uniref:C2H2-type domain-containing protein n=1 Tax=Cryphonectria parasitica (strain ATCC 38755 / EP155) TaxID=660469 RepID=A0A9P4Y859_CRYP1|nr:uncharacterized protein M406DRAFT_71534 [Cryphonectria parasitica EP155]KAF3768538.1 hypothetical protein M406DRAFT_71534 [Cryphonectria parasitica EP155]
MASTQEGSQGPIHASGITADKGMMRPTCFICQQSFGRRNELTRHARVYRATLSVPFQCSECKRRGLMPPTTQIPAQWSNHVERVHSKQHTLNFLKHLAVSIPKASIFNEIIYAICNSRVPIHSFMHHINAKHIDGSLNDQCKIVTCSACPTRGRKHDRSSSTPEVEFASQPMKRAAVEALLDVRLQTHKNEMAVLYRKLEENVSELLNRHKCEVAEMLAAQKTEFAEKLASSEDRVRNDVVDGLEDLVDEKILAEQEEVELAVLDRLSKWPEPNSGAEEGDVDSSGMPSALRMILKRCRSTALVSRSRIEFPNHARTPNQYIENLRAFVKKCREAAEKSAFWHRGAQLEQRTSNLSTQ